MGRITIFGVMLEQRDETAPNFQKILTKYGCNIKSRIGLHNVADNICSPSGIILLEVIGKEQDISSLEKEINQLDNATIQKMAFEGPEL